MIIEQGINVPFFVYPTGSKLSANTGDTGFICAISYKRKSLQVTWIEVVLQLWGWFTAISQQTLYKSRNMAESLPWHRQLWQLWVCREDGWWKVYAEDCSKWEALVLVILN